MESAAFQVYAMKTVNLIVIPLQAVNLGKDATMDVDSCVG